MLRSSKTIIDYYIGSYGPTIRIDTHLKDELFQLQDIFKNLKNETVLEFGYKNLENVEMSGLTDLILKVVKGKGVLQKNIKKIDNSSCEPIFIWSLTNDDWEYCEGLLEGLIRKGNSGHQYLTNEKDGVLIEVAFGE